MGRNVYCVLKGRPEDIALDDDKTPHIEIKVSARGWYRVAVNAQSTQPPHELLFAAIDPFDHPILRILNGLPKGLTDLSKRRMPALDYTRGGFIRRGQMKIAPFRLRGPKNDLREFLGLELAEAIKTEDAMLYAFGESWGPEPNRPDRYFGFKPGRGVHDVHMNQGSRGRFRGANRARQDGALLLHFPSQKRWVGLFFAFQSQSWRNDPKKGHPLPSRH